MCRDLVEREVVAAVDALPIGTDQRVPVIRVAQLERVPPRAASELVVAEAVDID